ncbi:hypothetical protein LMH73_015345 [Vibrio splendidus]|nr:hypothetical protein [Vibrio splendidus]MCC4881497.1 hypothetical protein [Vibrio splendidus]
MKNKLSILTLSIALASPFCAAQDNQNYDTVRFYHDAHKGNNFLSYNASQQSEVISSASKEQKDLLLFSLQSLATLHTKHSNDKIETAILDVMESMHPELETKWDNISHIDGRKIYQDDDTIHHEQIDHDFVTPKENRVRLEDGLAPFSYDGRVIKICSLTRSPESSYFELLNTQTKAFINLSQSGMSIEEACVGIDEPDGYWKSRNDDFVNERADYTSRYHYE